MLPYPKYVNGTKINKQNSSRLPKFINEKRIDLSGPYLGFFSDYIYEILELPVLNINFITFKIFKHQYFKLSLKYHPDKSINTKEKFINVYNAYEYVKNFYGE